MLTGTALRNFKPKSKTYKFFDRDGMYVTGCRPLVAALTGEEGSATWQG